MLVVNTCAFIDSAKQESIDAILEMAQHKAEGSCQRLIVTGCLAERYRDELRKEIPEIDAVLGTGDVPEIVERDRRRGTHRCGFTDPALYRFRRALYSAPGTEHSTGSAQHSTGSSDLHLRRRHAAAARDAAALRVREDRRRLRLQVRVLHHPDAARAPIAAGRPTRSSGKRARWPSAASRSCCSSRRTRPSTASTGSERGALARLLRELERRRRPRVDPPALPLPHDDRRRDAGGHGRVRQGLQVHRPAAAARLEPGAEADEAARHAPEVRRAAGPDSRQGARASRSAPRSSSGSRARRSADVGRARARSSRSTPSITSGCSPTRTRKARRRSRWTTTCRRRTKQARRQRVMAPPEAAGPAAANAARIGETRRVLVDGPSGDHELVLKGRLASQAPDIDAVGLSDRMRPVELARRGFCRGRNRRRARLRPDCAANSGLKVAVL